MTLPGAERPGAADEAGDDSPAVVSHRAVETVTLATLLAFSLLLAWDNWKTGIGWDSTGPRPGYFPFYIAMIMAGACAFGLVRDIVKPPPRKAFVTRSQFRRVLQVFVPTLAFVPLTEWLGIYVASFLLISGFMIAVGRIKAWIAVATALVFSVGMFVVFQIAFDVIMPKGPLERLLGY